MPAAAGLQKLLLNSALVLVLLALLSSCAFVVVEAASASAAGSGPKDASESLSTPSSSSVGVGAAGGASAGGATLRLTWRGQPLFGTLQVLDLHRLTALSLGRSLSWLSLSLSDVYAVGSCESALSSSKQSGFDFCVNEAGGGRGAESGDCRTKHALQLAGKKRRILVALKGTELCNRTPYWDTLKLLLFGEEQEERAAVKAEPGPGPRGERTRSASAGPEGKGDGLLRGVARRLSDAWPGRGRIGARGSGGESRGKVVVLQECFIPISPFKRYNATVQVQARGKGAGVRCSISFEERRSTWRLAMVLAGMILVCFGPRLSESMSFRVSVGALVAMVTGLVVALYYLSKRPRTTAVSSMLLAIAAMNQTWWRSLLSESNFTKAMACYCLAAACGGAFVSFYYDTALSTPRATAIVSCCFQMAGSILVYFNSHSVLLSSLFISAAFSAHIWSLLPTKVAAPFAKAAATGGEPPATEISGPGSCSNSAEEKVVGEDGGKEEMVSPGEISADGEEAGSLRRRPLSPIAPMRSPGSAGEEDRPQVAHCVTQGMIMNEETNRLIGIGKGTYNKLVKGGWVVDESIGVISPPSKQKKRD